MASSPLDASRPLWQFDLVERYGGGSALVQVLLSLTDTTRKPAKDSDLAKAWLKQGGAPVAQRLGARHADVCRRT